MSDTKKLIIGGGDFSLVVGAVAAPSAETNYDAATAAFGNISTVAFNSESTLVEHMGSYQGVKIRDDVFITSIKNGFKLTCEEFDANAMRGLFFADAGVDDTDPNFLKYVPMSAANSMRGYGRLRIYDGRDSTGVPVIKWVDFSCVCKISSQPSFDGENYGSYEMDVHVLSDLGNVIVKKIPAP